jgi:nuclear transcription factor Y gamma
MMMEGSQYFYDDSSDLNEMTEEIHAARMQNALARYWEVQRQEMEALDVGTEQEFKNHNDLPLARIKRIMKSDEDVRMISAEAPVLFAKACEMFILELSLRGWGEAERAKRRTLQKEDIEAAINNTDIFDFLVGLPSTTS